MRIYVVYKAVYSKGPDYTIGIFDSREKAEKAQKKWNDAHETALQWADFYSEEMNEYFDGESETTWADRKMDELVCKGKENWEEDDWDAYHYIEQFRFESGYYDE